MITHRIIITATKEGRREEKITHISSMTYTVRVLLEEFCYDGYLSPGNL